jgi:hypothetical protein
MKVCIDDRLPVKRLSGRLLGVALLLALFALGQQENAFAQAGSTGGTIGKQDKSISGGDETDRPRAAPLEKRPAANTRETPSRASKNSLIGRWQWHAQCTNGTTWEAAFVATAADKETVALDFIGAGGGTGTGVVTGNRVRLLRAYVGPTQTWTATLSGGNRMNGEITSSQAGHCTFQASR